MCIRWKLLTTIAALASVAFSAGAQGLSPIAFEELKPIAERSLQLNGDVTSATRGILLARAGVTNAICFINLSMSVTEFNSELLRLQTLILIADEMHDPYDARKVLLQVKDISATLLKGIEADRPFVNHVPADCPTTAFVAVKAQELLNIYTSAAPLLRSIVARIPL